MKSQREPLFALHTVSLPVWLPGFKPHLLFWPEEASGAGEILFWAGCYSYGLWLLGGTLLALSAKAIGQTKPGVLPARQLPDYFRGSCQAGQRGERAGR